jgi:hypothetical protein
MNKADERQLLEERKLTAAVNREIYRQERITASRIDDIEQAELAATWRNQVLNARKPNLETELRDAGKWVETDSDDGWIEAAGRYINLVCGYDHEGRLKIFNADLLIEGTYHRAAISYTSETEFARVDCGEEERRGPFCGTYGLGSCLTSHRSARSPEITVTDGDVISINCRDFRVRVFRNEYIALDRIERDGTLTPQGAH